MRVYGSRVGRKLGARFRGDEEVGNLTGFESVVLTILVVALYERGFREAYLVQQTMRSQSREEGAERRDPKG